jgi:formylglycine-generating enzyme required for sulfatase activity
MAKIEAFETTRKGVEVRLMWARAVEELTNAHPRARVSWPEAAAAVRAADGEAASTLYAALPIDLRPQTGLVPIGRNPATGLWEFYHLRSAWDPQTGIDGARALEVPAHDRDGRIAVGEGTGIVFVLLPGGTFTMGASADPSSPNHDPDAKPHERPHEVRVQPFLLARHELTHGQWARLSSAPDPSHYAAGSEIRTPYGGGVERITGAHPIEGVSWNASNLTLGHHGLCVPTSEQWEYACRAGSGSAWYPGGSVADLEGAANVMDARAKRMMSWTQVAVPWDDGYVFNAPVGTFAANAFGIHDTHGNVWEWCQDGTERTRMARGGSHAAPARSARAANWNLFPPDTRNSALGARASRVLE